MGSVNQTIASNEATLSANGEKPWLNQKGHALSESEIKLVSKDWSLSTWEKYLDSLDTSLSDQQLNPRDYDEIAEKMEFGCFEFSQTDADEETKDKIAAVMKNLSPQQQKILAMIFWQGRSERFIAFELRLSRSTVKTLKKRALRKLTALLKQVSPVSPLMRGEKSPLRNGDQDDKGVLSLAQGILPKAS